MEEKKELVNSEKLADLAVLGMLEKKASDIVVMDLRNVKGAVADFFVISSASSDTQVEAVAKSVDEAIYKGANEDPWHREGTENREWILLDYVNVVAHIMKTERREFFNLEGLWGDAVIKRIQAED
ncbi:ribosomal silencing factor RsfS [Fulvitalea axinellae]|uniref:Ribosomal silencing factor RsfS n=1 Tax=Fulvitalea axinellae TaxID=1182444 RepID=A0AAU9CGU0_9BACT|nr:ribosomal silencing factor RsfS [Fulvitalea axinellae]